LCVEQSALLLENNRRKLQLVRRIRLPSDFKNDGGEAVWHTRWGNIRGLVMKKQVPRCSLRAARVCERSE
jgi:hypothetical protein